MAPLGLWVCKSANQAASAKVAERYFFSRRSMISMRSSPCTLILGILTNSDCSREMTSHSSICRIATISSSSNPAAPRDADRQVCGPFAWLARWSMTGEPSRCQVTTEEGRRIAHSYNATYIEASALTGANVNAVFETFVREVRKKKVPKPKKSACQIL